MIAHCHRIDLQLLMRSQDLRSDHVLRYCV